MKKFLLALDLGTTRSRALVFDAKGTVVSVARKALSRTTPRASWVEHDPEEIWSSQCEVAMEALAEAGLQGKEIAAIGITNQRETTLVWERATGRAISPAIGWQDRRTEEICERLRAAGHDDIVRSRTGLVIDSYFSAPKIRWILDNIDGARDRADRGDLAFG